MNAKTLVRFHRFGRVGRIVMTLLLAFAILVTAVSVAATVYICALPDDALTVRVTSHAEFQINAGSFRALWNILADQLAYAGDAEPSGILNGTGGAVLPPENQTVQTELSFFNRSYSTAAIYSDGSMKRIEAESAPAEYCSADLGVVMIFLTLLCVCTAAALFLLRQLFAVLAACESPFCEAFVKKLRAFGISLLPVVLFATVGQTLSTSFLSAGRDGGLQIQWGVLVAFAVTMCLVTVFRYGVQLQKESDETL